MFFPYSFFINVNNYKKASSKWNKCVNLDFDFFDFVWFFDFITTDVLFILAFTHIDKIDNFRFLETSAVGKKHRAENAVFE